MRWTRKQIESAATVVGHDNGDLRGGEIRRADVGYANGLLALGHCAGPNGQDHSRNGRVAGRVIWSAAARAAEVDL